MQKKSQQKVHTLELLAAGVSLLCTKVVCDHKPHGRGVPTAGGKGLNEISKSLRSLSTVPLPTHRLLRDCQVVF